MDTTDLHVVIPAGGSGTRLWPLSRAANPKFLHALTGTDRSLLQATFDRLAPLAGARRVYVVTGATHAASVARQLPGVPEANILTEPFPRDSCAAIALAAAVIAQRDPSAVMGSFAADHLIQNLDVFAGTVRAAVAGAHAGYLMTIGITPTRPETGYGYVHRGPELEPAPIRQVLEFKEKPPLEVATAYVESGDYLWNASMFAWRVDVFLAELRQRCPRVYEPVVAIAEAWDTPRREEVVAGLWPTIPKIAVDYAVMEPAAAAGKVAMVPGDFGWSDIGDFDTLGQLLGDEAADAVVVDPAHGRDAGASVLAVDSPGLVVVPGGGRMVATLGVRDLIVVDTPDAVMVCRRDRAQDVKKLTEILRERGDTTYI